MIKIIQGIIKLWKTLRILLKMMLSKSKDDSEFKADSIESKIHGNLVKYLGINPKSIKIDEKNKVAYVQGKWFMARVRTN